MKLLFDQNLSYRLIEQVTPAFPGTSHVARHGLTSATDIDVWEFAKANEYVLVSKDQDFYHLSCCFGPPPPLIWIRTGNRGTDVIGRLILEHRQEIQELLSGPSAMVELFP